MKSDAPTWTAIKARTAICFPTFFVMQYNVRSN